LSVDDWIQAGFAILAAEGIKALKIDRLCRHLAVTKGSFYWHLTDIASIPRRTRAGVGRVARRGAPPLRRTHGASAA
jgi:AcrR family transcriptional regulator